MKSKRYADGIEFFPKKNEEFAFSHYPRNPGHKYLPDPVDFEEGSIYRIDEIPQLNVSMLMTDGGLPEYVQVKHRIFRKEHLSYVYYQDSERDFRKFVTSIEWKEIT